MGPFTTASLASRSSKSLRAALSSKPKLSKSMVVNSKPAGHPAFSSRDDLALLRICQLSELISMKPPMNNSIMLELRLGWG